jgi:integrase
MPNTTAPLAIPAGLEDLWDQVGQYVEASRASSTLAGYRSDLQTFGRWADAHHLDAGLPVAPGIVASFLAEQAQLVCSGTLARRCSSIRWAHEQAGHASPTAHPLVKRTMAGIRRTRQDGKRQARPVYLDDLAAMVEGLGDSPKDLRDRAALSVGWWGAFRRSELVGLRWSDVADHPQGMTARLGHSKTDQTGKGRLVPLHYHAVPVCPVRALRAWRTIATMPDGGADGELILRRVDRWGHVHSDGLAGQAVSLIVKEAAARVGLDPAGYSGHSLRAGFVSECDRRGIATSAVRLVTGHASDVMLATYTRPRSLFDASAGAMFGDAA